jgi:hypothetical protein
VTFTWSAGDPAEPATSLPPLPARTIGDVDPLGEAALWGGEVRAGAHGRPGLILGHLDGTHRVLLDLGESPRWDGASIISGPASGVVLVAVQRGTGWGLQTVSLDTGEVRQLIEVDANLWDAVLDPSARAAYWLYGGEASNGGVWRIDLVTGAIDRVLEPDPVARDNGTVLAAAVRQLGQLAISEKGDQLAVLECFHECRLRLVDLAAGSFQDYDPPASTGQELVGFVPAGIDFWGGCIRLPSGEVSERCPDPDGAAAALEAEQAMGFGVELPAGWMLEVEPVPDAPIMSFDSMALAVSTETGVRIRLRAIGTVHGQ